MQPMFAVVFSTGAH